MVTSLGHVPVGTSLDRTPCLRSNGQTFGLFILAPDGHVPRSRPSVTSLGHVDGHVPHDPSSRGHVHPGPDIPLITHTLSRHVTNRDVTNRDQPWSRHVTNRDQPKGAKDVDLFLLVTSLGHVTKRFWPLSLVTSPDLPWALPSEGGADHVPRSRPYCGTSPGHVSVGAGPADT